MFTGIIEGMGNIIHIDTHGQNRTFRIKSELSKHLKVDQSLAHNGICLTVVEQNEEWHDVTAIHETLELTASKSWKVGDLLNLERAATLHARLDGHIVQGHVDCTGKIDSIIEEDGSWRYKISFNENFAKLLISKGSICIDGVSLTVISPTLSSFEVAIIPYTYEHTVFHKYDVGNEINLEFDLIGKYILRSQEVEKLHA